MAEHSDAAVELVDVETNNKMFFPEVDAKNMEDMTMTWRTASGLNMLPKTTQSMMLSKLFPTLRDDGRALTPFFMRGNHADDAEDLTLATHITMDRLDTLQNIFSSFDDRYPLLFKSTTMLMTATATLNSLKTFSANFQATFPSALMFILSVLDQRTQCLHWEILPAC